MTHGQQHLASEPKEELTSLLREQQADLTQLRELVARQRLLIQRDQHGDLLSLLDERQKILERLLKRQERIGTLGDRVRSQPEAMDDETRRQLGHVIDDLSSCLGDIMQRDEEDQKSMEKIRDESRQELNSLGQARQARRAYLKPGMSTGPNDARFSDRKG